MTVGRTVLSAAAATAAAALLVGGVAVPAASAAPPSAPVQGTAPAGDTTPAAMTRARAARYYLDAACPSTEALDALALAQEDPDVTWGTLQPLIRAEADAQMRLARMLSRPPRPWPANVRRLIPTVVELQYAQGGMNYVLAAASSVEEYNTLLAGLLDYSPGMDPLMERWFEVSPMIKRRLGLPVTGACDGR